MIHLYDIIQNYSPDELGIDKKAKYIWKNIVYIFEKQYTYVTHLKNYPKCYLKVLKHWLQLTPNDCVFTDEVLTLEEYGRSKKHGYGKYSSIVTHKDGSTAGPFLVNWEVYLGYVIDPQNFTNEELIAYHLYEVTWSGFKPNCNSEFVENLKMKGQKLQEDYDLGKSTFIPLKDDFMDKIQLQPDFEEKQKKAALKRAKLKIVKVAYDPSMYHDDSSISDFSHSEDETDETDE